jgi:hypothetical protein
VGSTNDNVRIKLIPPYLRYADHWKSGFEKLDGDIPTHGIYESESTHERYSGYESVRFGSTVPPDLRRYILLRPIASEINLTEGEILKLIEVIPLR